MSIEIVTGFMAREMLPLGMCSNLSAKIEYKIVLILYVENFYFSIPFMFQFLKNY